MSNLSMTIEWNGKKSQCNTDNWEYEQALDYKYGYEWEIVPTGYYIAIKMEGIIEDLPDIPIYQRAKVVINMQRQKYSQKITFTGKLTSKVYNITNNVNVNIGYTFYVRKGIDKYIVKNIESQ